MPGGAAHRPQRLQAGFSMIEMLATAFIMAVGILGLTVLQTMALKATRGGRSLGTALLVAEQVLDQAEREGRLSWLIFMNTNGNSTAAEANWKYISLTADGSTAALDQFNSKGGAFDQASTDPAGSQAFFTARTTRVLVPSDGTSINGHLSALTVQVVFSDEALGQAAVVRSVTLTRMISHG